MVLVHLSLTPIAQSGGRDGIYPMPGPAKRLGAPCPKGERAPPTAGAHLTRNPYGFEVSRSGSHPSGAGLAGWAIGPGRFQQRPPGASPSGVTVTVLCHNPRQPLAGQAQSRRDRLTSCAMRGAKRVCLNRLDGAVSRAAVWVWG